jgi:hypothetical protein
MSDFSGMEHIVERVVSQVLQGHLPQLRDELVRRVVEELPAGEEGAAGNEFNVADLLRRISVIHAGTTQKEVLRALLDGAARYSGRTALFVIKSGAATGWQARGFDDNESVREFALNVSRGLAERVLSEKASFTGQSIDMDPRFVDHYGSPASEHVLLLPLLVKEKVAALLYADGGMDVNRPVESAAIELLVQFAGQWLELSSLRKQAPRDPYATPYASNERMETMAPPPPAAASAPSFNDPFAGHAPAHTMMAAAAPARAPEPPAMVEQAHAEPQAEAMNAEPVIAESVSTPAIAESAAAAMSPEDADTHRKAQRFARLLVDEIKLYNSAKVAEGRKNKDLYDRLKEDIEKSRATYKKRYGATVAANADYFQVELVRSLAEDDVSIMGPNFRR